MTSVLFLETLRAKVDESAMAIHSMLLHVMSRGLDRSDPRLRAALDPVVDAHGKLLEVAEALAAASVESPEGGEPVVRDSQTAPVVPEGEREPHPDRPQNLVLRVVLPADFRVDEAVPLEIQRVLNLYGGQPDVEVSASWEASRPSSSRPEGEGQACSCAGLYVCAACGRKLSGESGDTA